MAEPVRSHGERPGAGGVTAVLFDLYGTLVDIVLDEVSPVFWEGLAGHLESGRAGLTASSLRHRYLALCRDEEARQGSRRLLDRVFRRLLSDLGRSSSPRDVERLGEFFRASSTRAFRVKEYAGPVLAAVRRSGCRIGLVSNTEAVLTRFDLRRSGLASWFDVIVLSSEVGVRKPDPRIFLGALRRLRVAAGRAVMVGNDLRADLGGARGAGLRTLLVDPAGPALVAAALPPGPEVVGVFPTETAILAGLARLGWRAPARGRTP